MCFGGKMNKWTKLSIKFANQRNYLDELFTVYPTIPDGIREIDKDVWEDVEKAFNEQNNIDLMANLLKLKLFPIKNSYVAYLRRDKSAIQRNPKTINRISGRLYEMGLDSIYEKCSEPKETNRQIGPMFKDWLSKKSLGITPIGLKDFINSNKDAVLVESDEVMKQFAKEKLNYQRDKGLDFVARFNGKYIIGEAKFLTDFGGHQNAQFEDALTTLKSKDVKATVIAILDGVLYIEGGNKMHKQLLEYAEKYNIMSALLLRDFLYQL